MTTQGISVCGACGCSESEDEKGRRTASIGFSVANFDIFAMTSFRFSGGNMLSIQAEPLLRTPPTVP